ncbi:TetR/AcrR family transcriptional regulator [Actinomycetaceae bacterium MB13-C1-2]|nr:TetR/AcrR family transcriptional regulator [Actinomycetaceae bacterium MB13-C1-2]
MSKANRGPAAAAENRDSLMQSARTLFASHGLSVPFSAIARDAGVSQGVLYRHFPTQKALALAVFEENLERIEKAVEQRNVAVSGLEAAWEKLVELTINDAAFVEIAVNSGGDPQLEQVRRRITSFLDALITSAQERGEVGRDVTSHVLFVALRAVYGLVSTGVSERDDLKQDIRFLLGCLGLAVPDSPGHVETETLVG